MSFFPPDFQANSTVINGVVTVLFPGVSFYRLIRRLIVSCSTSSSVVVYSGMPGGLIIAQNRFGNQNTFAPANPSPIPPGTPIYVQFPDAIAGTDTAVCTLACTGELTA
jgi:hypothetical protein